ncbi:MAG: hypothetical protein JWN04_5100 [Myxococcaceae bacterium]|nr:hypothetical protein [Myxococcaceae bacterium]
MAKELSTCVFLSLALGSSACTYDLEKLYEHEVGDDAGMGGDAARVGLSSQQLIGAWIGNDPLVNASCVACAEAKCGDAETACRADPECVAYTQCVGQSPNPGGQDACRVSHMPWVRADVRAHDLNGPYGQCVFKYNCAAECGGNDDLTCLQKYSRPSTPAAMVPLHLYLADAIMPTAAVSGVQVKVCAATDLTCAHPTGQGTTDATGLVELSLPTTYSGSFTGYFEIEGGQLYPSLLKFSWNLGVETTYVLNTVNKDLFNQSISLIGLTPKSGLGMLQLRMLGCSSIGLRGASFTADTADAMSKTWYIDGLPKLDLTATGTVGSGGIVNVKEGSALVTATRASDMAVIGKIDAPVRASYMTIVVLEPSPQ